MSLLSLNKFSLLTSVSYLTWWVYIILAFALFFAVLLLNYIVKKINEARLENRINSLRNKVAANQSTQVLENAVGNTAEVGNLGLPLVFNKDYNIVEDIKNKYEPEIIGTGTVVIEMTTSENIKEDISSIQSNKDEVMNKSAFLGSIYKELYEKRETIDKTKSLSNADRDSILNEIVDKMVAKIKESKSTPSIIELLDIQNEDNIEDWALDLVKKNTDTAQASTSGCC